MFDIKCQPELYLVDVWYQSSIQWLLVHDWYSYTLDICFLCISGYVDSKKRIQFWHFFWLDFVIFACMKSHSSSNINQNCTWLMFDIKRQPKLYLVDVWYQMSTRTLSGWYLISIINQVATGSWLIFIYSRYVFSLHFSLCRFQKTYTILTLFLTGLCHFCLYEKSFFVKHQPKLYLVDVWYQTSKKLYLVDVWYQTSTRTVSGWCLISNVNQNSIWLMFDINHQSSGSIGWLLVHDWYSYTLGMCFLCISGYVDSKNVYNFDTFLSFLLVWKIILHQTSTKTVPGWCLKSNVNQNFIWLMFDIKRQPKLHLVDVWYQMSTRTLSGWYLISIINRVATGSWLIFIYSRYVFSLHFRVCRFQKTYTILTLFLTRLCHFCLYEKSYFVKHQPKLYLVDVWYQTSTKTLSDWCLISNVNQNCIWLMFDIKCQPELYLVDIWYQSSIRWLLVHGWYSYTLGMSFLCISGYVDSKKHIQFWHFFWLDFVIFACMKSHSSSNINQNCTWLMFDIKRQPKLYLVDVWYQTSTRTVSGWCLISIVKRQTSTVLRCRSWFVY